jgi:hypothetical protein
MRQDPEHAIRFNGLHEVASLLLRYGLWILSKSLCSRRFCHLVGQCGMRCVGGGGKQEAKAAGPPELRLARGVALPTPPVYRPDHEKVGQR